MTEADASTGDGGEVEGAAVVGQLRGLGAEQEQFRGLCAELNMDVETGELAWRTYLATKQKYTLEGDQLHWLACALYVACRRGNRN